MMVKFLHTSNHIYNTPTYEITFHTVYNVYYPPSHVSHMYYRYNHTSKHRNSDLLIKLCIINYLLIYYSYSFLDYNLIRWVTLSADCCWNSGCKPWTNEEKGTKYLLIERLKKGDTFMFNDSCGKIAVK